MGLVCYPTSALESQIESHGRCSGHCALRHQLHVARRSMEARQLRSGGAEVALYQHLLGHHHWMLKMPAHEYSNCAKWGRQELLHAELAVQLILGS